MIKRILSLLLGVGLIALVVWLGLKTRNDQSLVIWFGLASAILAPTGFAAIGYSLTASNRQVLERLSKVPEIEHLITAAKTQEEKIGSLERERARLLEVVEFEARKESLSRRKGSLEQDGSRILNELEAIDAELSSLKIISGPVTEEIRRLQARIRARQEGDLVFRIGSRHFLLKREIFIGLPYGGVVFENLKLLLRMKKSVSRVFSPRGDR
jgi:hypothetical protein